MVEVDPLVDVVAVDGIVVQLPSQSTMPINLQVSNYYENPPGRPAIVVPTTNTVFFLLDALIWIPQVFYSRRWPDGTRASASFKACMEHYVAHVVKTPKRTLDRLREGIELEDDTTAPAEVESISDLTPDEGSSLTGVRKNRWRRPNALVNVTIREGRKHQVKKMLLAIHHRVLVLHR